GPSGDDTVEAFRRPHLQAQDRQAGRLELLRPLLGGGGAPCEADSREEREGRGQGEEGQGFRGASQEAAREGPGREEARGLDLRGGEDDRRSAAARPRAAAAGEEETREKDLGRSRCRSRGAYSSSPAVHRASAKARCACSLRTARAS